MSNDEVPAYERGQVVNGYVWTGSEWLQVVRPAAQPVGMSKWRVFGAVGAFIAAGVAGLQGLTWLFRYLQLERDGNQFAGFLSLLSMGALAVAVAFGLAGVFLVTKRN